MLCSCFASNSLVDQQSARSGFCVYGFGTRPCFLVFVGSGYDDPTDSERTSNAPRRLPADSPQRFPKISELFPYPDPQKPDRAACRLICVEEIAAKQELIVSSIFIYQDTCKMYSPKFTHVVLYFKSLTWKRV